MAEQQGNETTTDRFSVDLLEGRKDWRSGEPRGRLLVISDGEEIIDQEDGGEPEDQTFGRDWAWVPDAIRRAYETGLQHAREETSKK